MGVVDQPDLVGLGAAAETLAGHGQAHLDVGGVHGTDMMDGLAASAPPEDLETRHQRGAVLI
jgi:hypothetical protein